MEYNIRNGLTNCSEQKIPVFLLKSELLLLAIYKDQTKKQNIIHFVLTFSHLLPYTPPILQITMEKSQKKYETFLKTLGFLDDVLQVKLQS